MAQRKIGKRKRRGTGGKPDRAGPSLAKRARQRVSHGTLKAAKASLARARDLGDGARKVLHPGIHSPHISLLQAPLEAPPIRKVGDVFRVASYNVHRWAGLNGRGKPNIQRAGAVIAALDADVIALQEALRPTGEKDSLEGLAQDLGLHLAFAATRIHKRGELGNAILSRYPITAISVLDLFSSRIESRCALAASFDIGSGTLGVVATHLSLVDRTRHRQVEMLLRHPQWNAGPAILLGDMNAWRECKASQNLEDTLHRHSNVDWPATFPASRPIFALDRIYASGAAVISMNAHDTHDARRASDHLPVVAQLSLSVPE